MRISRKGAEGVKAAKKKTRGSTAAEESSRKDATKPAPRAGRPNIPGYGIVGEKEGRGLLPWSWAEKRLARGRNYWLVTTRPGGRPHLMPIWGVWREGAFWFSTGEKTVKARNLAANPSCVVAPDRADEAVIVEGTAEWVPASESLQPLWDAYKKKYAWDMNGTGFYAVRPRAAFGFIEKGDLFTQTATRWRF